MIRFACPACSARMKAVEGKARRKGTCPKCGAAFTLTACPGCGRAIALRPQELASRIVCAGCDTAFVMAASSPAANPSGQSDAADAKPPLVPENLPDLPPGTVRFFCTNCQTSLNAPAEQIGAQTKCPQCGPPVRVPGPLVPMPQAAYRPPAQPTPEVVPVQEVILDALPADEGTWPGEVEEEIADALPADSAAEQQLVRPGRYHRLTCSFCRRLVRVPREDSGRVLPCPSCRMYFRAPGRCWDEDDGLPAVVQVSARLLFWPKRCACCLRPHDTCVRAIHRQYTTRGLHGTAALISFCFPDQYFWEVPYCWECAEHIHTGYEEGTNPGCCNVEEAVEYNGFSGTVHQFRFFNFHYANAFIALNRDKCLG